MLSYAQRVGERLRTVRLQQRLSLRGVAAASNGEFRASVLGAYEGGQRTISVVRLQRLALFYNVPVEQLLPSDVPDGASWWPREDEGAGPAATGKLTIDLARLAEQHFPEKAILQPYVHSVRLQRRDFHGRVITLRDDDAKIIAGLLSCSVDQLRQRLQQCGVAC